MTDHETFEPLNDADPEEEPGLDKPGAPAEFEPLVPTESSPAPAAEPVPAAKPDQEEELVFESLSAPGDEAREDDKADQAAPEEEGSAPVPPRPASPEDQDLDDTEKRGKTVRNILIILAYWFTACLCFILVIAAIVFLTAPKDEIPPTATITPDLTETLRAALATAEPTLPPTKTFTPSPVPSQTPTSPPTTTPLPSNTPTQTLTPSVTSTVTPIPPPPTLTPARPQEDSEAFQIAEWLPEEYSYAISLSEGYPDTMSDTERGPQDENYYAAYQYATIIQGEALLAFPQEPEAVGWEWGLAYNLSRLSTPQSASRYALLITRGLRSGEVEPEYLSAWIHQQDPRLWLTVDPRPAALDDQSNSLLVLNSEGGSAYLWLVETPGEAAVYPLASAFDFPARVLSDHYWSDLTGDSTQELVVYQPNSPVRAIILPRVFDLSTNPPVELGFKPNQDFEIGLESEYAWRATANDAGGEDLVYSAVVYPACPVTIMHTYSWNGLWIERSQADYTIAPSPGIVSYCELVVDQAAAVWGPDTAIPLMESLLPDWPPRSPSEPKQYPLDAQDEWRYRLGIYYTLSGYLLEADEYFAGIIAYPSTKGSRWIDPAREFQAGLSSPESIYQVCVPSSFCDQRIALENWVASLPPEASSRVLYYLTGGGVAIRYTDVFDFEGDGIPERYFVFRHHPDEQLEFWIIAEKESGPAALFVDIVDESMPVLTRYTTRAGISIVWLGAQQSFTLSRFPGTDEVYITRYPPSYFYEDFTLETVDASMTALLSGAAPEPVIEELIALRRSENFACLTDEDCAYFYYTLGFAYERLLDEEEAVKNYIHIWNEYPRTPLTGIVRLKLEYKPGFGPPPTYTPTPTITNTPTNTPTITPTPTLTHTPGPSPTPSPTLTVTPGPSPTITLTPTDGPSPTPTATGTATHTPTITDTPTNTPDVTATSTQTPSTPYP